MKIYQHYFSIVGSLMVITNFFLGINDTSFVYLLAIFMLVMGLYFPKKRNVKKKEGKI